jgi:hypothetical protein
MNAELELPLATGPQNVSVELPQAPVLQIRIHAADIDETTGAGAAAVALCI